MLSLVIGILAVARLTLLLTEEIGPMDMFLLIRKYFGLLDIINEDGSIEKIRIEQDNKLKENIAEILSCNMCCSVWAGVFVVILNMIPYLALFNTILALSMGAILLINVKDKM